MAGLIDKKRERDEAEINASSMADIAFLLLIFFLVTTTINVDTGIGMTLPPKLDEQEPPPVKERNMLKILINENGDVLLEDEPSSTTQIREEVVTHVTNRGQNPAYAEGPDKAVVSIKTSAGTPYDQYIEVLDEVWMAYFELWNNEARQRGFANYDAYKASLGEDEENEIRELYKAQISIAEPDPGQS